MWGFFGTWLAERYLLIAPVDAAHLAFNLYVERCAFKFQFIATTGHLLGTGITSLLHDGYPTKAVTIYYAKRCILFIYIINFLRHIRESDSTNWRQQLYVACRSNASSHTICLLSARSCYIEGLITLMPFSQSQFLMIFLYYISLTPLCIIYKSMANFTKVFHNLLMFNFSSTMQQQ